MFAEEALYVGFREGLKVGAVYVAWVALHGSSRMREATVSFVAGLGGALLVMLALSMVDSAMEVRDLSQRLGGYVMFLTFFSASVILLRAPHDWPQRLASPSHWFSAGLICLALSPEFIHMRIVASEMTALKGSALAVHLPLWAGFGLLSSAGLYVGRRWAGRVEGYFGLGQFFLFLALLKLLMSGSLGLNEATLVPTVQRGVMKFVHDIVHQSFVFLLVPDHPILKLTTWNFIGFFFGSYFSMVLALALLLGPSLTYLYKCVTEPLMAPADALTGAIRRLHRADIRAARMRHSVVVAGFVVVVALSWYVGGTERTSVLFLPESTPLIEDKGMVVVPLVSPGEDLMDGRIHKFSVLVDGKVVRLLMVRKSDGVIAVTLDACEICPPDGYGQDGQRVFCLYCMTPIPVDTLGRPGGCNPIPLDAEITGRDVRVSMEEVRTKWRNLVFDGGNAGGETQ